MNQKEIVVYSGNQFEGGDATWPPSRVSEFIEWLQILLDQIPEEFRSSASIEIDGSMAYDQGYAEIKVSYTRPFTDEEVEFSKQQEKRDFIAAMDRWVKNGMSWFGEDDDSILRAISYLQAQLSSNK